MFLIKFLEYFLPSIAKILARFLREKSMRKMIQLIIIDTGPCMEYNSFIDAVARAIGNNRFETFIMKDKHIFQKLGKKWLLIHILDCQGKKLMI